jgi:2TM domain-containing protein
MVTNEQQDDLLRRRAMEQLRKRHDFYGHLLVYVLVNAALVGIWAIAGGGFLFWPIFVILFWGIGLVMHAWDVFHPFDADETKIRQEMDRLRPHDV